MQPISFKESQQVLKVIAEQLRATTENVPVRQTLNRVLSDAVYAKLPNPPAAVAAMDGIAVNSFAIPDALVRLRSDQWKQINTGEPLPENLNTVIRIEDVNWEDDVPVLDKKPVFFHNVRRAGEDFEAGALLFPAEKQLHPQDVSLLLAAGIEQVAVYKRPVVTFVPTGSELVITPAQYQPGKIIESNSSMIKGMVESWGGQCRIMEPVPDDPDDLAQVIKITGRNSDIVVISAGTSRGTRDNTSEVIRLMGKIHFHGVDISPGKPVLLGEVESIPVLGLPGYPAAAYVCSYHYLRHLVCVLSHLQPSIHQSIFICADEITERKQDSFHRIHLYDIDGQTYVRKVEGGSGSAASLSEMDGLMHVPPNTPIKKRDGVRIDVFHERAFNSLAVRGVPDPGLFHLFNLWRRSMPHQRLLFWRSSPENAMQSIIERNLHVAAVNTPAVGVDPYISYLRQLQEPLHRYRAYTRTLGLTLRGDPLPEGLASAPKGMKIAIPPRNLTLWQSVLESEKVAPDYFHVFSAENEKILPEIWGSSNWDGIFCDIRFLKGGQFPFIRAKEHIDLIIPESYTELSSIKKLIELLLSDEYWMWLETQTGCDISSRGLVE